MFELVKQELNEIGVKMDDMVDVLYDLQKPYVENLSRKTCRENIESVLQKREAQHAILTGLDIDRLVQEGQFKQPIQDIIMKDEGRYGIDEIVALSITNIYGTIGLTNFGYLDKVKPGILKKLDGKQDGICRTFADDIVAAIIAAGASRLAHS